MINRYMDETLMERRIENEGHRSVVGGMWDVIGPLQRDFLVSQGLRPDHTVLDVGCGSLRGGVPLTGYLDANKYYGIDISQRLLDAGYEREILGGGLAGKLPRDHLFATNDFETPFDVMFDFAIAVSLFTHLPLSVFTRCLTKIAPRFAEGGLFYATVFEGEGSILRPSGVTTHDDRDPFHFTREGIQRATPPEWSFAWHGEWGHPRDQQMIRLTRRAVG